MENEVGHGGQAPPVGGDAPRLIVNNVEAAIDAAVAGLGVIETLSYQVAGQIAAGSLVRLLPDDLAPDLPVSLLFQGGRGAMPTVRAFVDLAHQRIGGTAL